ncbi:nucleotidyl transferase AbiEii/AbiGii toxin family protein [Candidatus Gottesmanbacteria bacterium]|nr:nucleotidyl transferase AbiEii/AbiGii toxin family protein [Candidatus Gottesmanbacteria bacterium]
MIFKRLKEILLHFGTLKQADDKKHTLSFILNYQKGERNLKVEISKRPSKSQFLLKNYLGISMLVMKEEDMVAGKLSALLTRKKLAMRDVFDVWFFLKNKWPINEMVITEKTGLSINKALEQAIKKVNSISKNQLLHGLGDLIDTKQKAWIKEKLIDETVFYLRLYKETHKE